MSVNAGQSLTPYPWSERKKFNDSRRMISPVVKVTRVLMYVASVLSPPSVLPWLWARFGFRRANDSWAKRGLVLVAAGLVGVVVFVPNPMAILSAWDTLLRSFGPDSGIDVQGAVIDAMLVAFPYALVIQGVHAMARSFQIERTTTGFLKPQRPTMAMKLRRARNVRQLERGVDPHRKGGYVRFGVIEDDRIPWRTSRHGMVVERKIERMGHGVFIGSNGTGKTKAAETFSHWVLSDDGAVIFIDFKASLSALRGLSAVARANNKPCYILDIGFGSTDTSWYDLFAWPGSPSDKASVLIECLQFPEGEGGTAYYRGIAEAWLPMQIEAAELVGLADGEGMFDFLLDTSVPRKFQERIESLRESSDPQVRATFERWNETAGLRKLADLEGLRSELTKIVNAAGDRLKPNAENPHPVSMKEVMDNGGMVYIGIASGVNDVVVKVLGSFLFRELSILVSARSRVPDTGALRDVFVIPDEASEMEERSVMMNPIYTMAREARIFLWPSFQSFAVWEESTRKEIQANTRNFVAFSIPERGSAGAIAETIPDIYALKQMSEETTQQQAFQEQTVGISGDARLEVVTDAFLRPNIELQQVPIHHAYIWFKDAPSISRDRWRGRRRVKKDQIAGDAPLVKLVPFSLVMPEHDDPDEEVHSDIPEVAESTVLPEERGGPATPAPASNSTESPFMVDATASGPVEDEEVPPDEDDEVDEPEAEPTPPPRLSFTTSRAGSAPTIRPQSTPPPQATPPPAEEDLFTDDGTGHHSDPVHAPDPPGPAPTAGTASDDEGESSDEVAATAEGADRRDDGDPSNERQTDTSRERAQARAGSAGDPVEAPTQGRSSTARSGDNPWHI